MPRTTEEILAHASELSQRFEEAPEFTPETGEWTEYGLPLKAIRDAFLDGAEAQARLNEAVTKARTEGFSWDAIGWVLGTSGEAARQKYGKLSA